MTPKTKTDNPGTFEDGMAAAMKGDYSTAVNILRYWADRGDARAQFHLAYAYSQGYGLQQDLNETAKWTRKSAEQGNSDAQYLLSGLYLEGLGVNKDTAEGIKWLRMAADNGLDEARSKLRDMIAKGMINEQGQPVRNDNRSDEEKLLDLEKETAYKPNHAIFYLSTIAKSCDEKGYTICARTCKDSVINIHRITKSFLGENYRSNFHATVNDNIAKIIYGSIYTCKDQERYHQ